MVDSDDRSSVAATMTPAVSCSLFAGSTCLTAKRCWFLGLFNMVSCFVDGSYLVICIPANRRKDCSFWRLAGMSYVWRPHLLLKKEEEVDTLQQNKSKRAMSSFVLDSRLVETRTEISSVRLSQASRRRFNDKRFILKFEKFR